MASSQRPVHSTDASYTFFKLPAELRLKIYDSLMNNTEDIWCCDEQEAKKIMDIRDYDSSRRQLSSQLLRTCRTVYHEALPRLYDHRIIMGGDIGVLAAKLNTIGKLACSLIREIILYPLDVLGCMVSRRGRSDFDDARILPPLPALEMCTVQGGFMHNFEVLLARGSDQQTNFQNPQRFPLQRASVAL